MLLVFTCWSRWRHRGAERSNERALEVLRDLSSPRALVIRDGQQRRIAGREVVRGDLLVLRGATASPPTPR